MLLEMSMCLYVPCVCVCVCVFRVTERVGVCNQERGYISLLHNEPLLCSGDKRKNKKDVSHLWHIYLDRCLTQSHSLPCWDILVRQMTSSIQNSVNGINTHPITAVEHFSAGIFLLPWELILTFLWIESEEHQARYVILLSAISSVPWILMTISEVGYEWEVIVQIIALCGHLSEKIMSLTSQLQATVWECFLNVLDRMCIPWI